MKEKTARPDGAPNRAKAKMLDSINDRKAHFGYLPERYTQLLALAKNYIGIGAFFVDFLSDLNIFKYK